MEYWRINGTVEFVCLVFSKQDFDVSQQTSENNTTYAVGYFKWHYKVNLLIIEE